MVLSLHMECIQIVCEWHLTFSLVSSAFSNLLQLGLGTTVKLCRRRKESLHESMKCGYGYHAWNVKFLESQARLSDRHLLV
ncbi:hypothetical protein LINPERHAP1_LOCUS3091 [Linum perenne]